MCQGVLLEKEHETLRLILSLQRRVVGLGVQAYTCRIDRSFSFKKLWRIWIRVQSRQSVPTKGMKISFRVRIPYWLEGLGIRCLHYDFLDVPNSA